MWLIRDKKAKGWAAKQSSYAHLNETQTLFIQVDIAAFLAPSCHILGVRLIFYTIFQNSKWFRLYELSKVNN